MIPKERVIKAIEHKEPDRVPIFASFTPEVAEMLKERFGVNEPELGVKLGNDIVLAEVGMVTSYYEGSCFSLSSGPPLKDRIYVDEWGIKWKWVKYRKGYYTEIIEHPLANAKLEDLKKYKIPDPLKKERFKEPEKIIKAYGSKYAIVGGLVFTIEAARYLRGTVKFFIDMIKNKEFANMLLDMVTDFHLKACKKLIEMGVDVIWVADDVGMQDRMMISPEVWREYLKQRYKMIFNEFKELNPEIKIAYHSDGAIEPIIPDLIEIGLDVLNPVQPKAKGMNPKELKRKYGSKLTFWGAIDVQWTMPFGTPKDVALEVKERIKTLAPGGGFIISPSHNIQPDTPIENILAFYQSAKEYGKYPIKDL
ncbi:MAG: uroporphyrinogen decarboxylase family protein [Candidatus Bathyarchaeia archaeon]